MYEIQNNWATNSIYAGLSAGITNLTNKLISSNAADFTGIATVSESILSSLADNKENTDSVQEGISLVQQVQDATKRIAIKLDRMEDIAQEVNDGGLNQGQINALQSEFDDLITDVDAIAAGTTPNNMLTVDGNPISISLGSGLSVSVDKKDLTITGLGVVEEIDLKHDSAEVLAGVQSAVAEVAAHQTYIDSKLETLDTASKVLDAQKETLLASKSIVDTLDAAMDLLGTFSTAAFAQTGLLISMQANISTTSAMRLIAD